MRRLLLSVLMVLMAGATLSAQRAQAPQRGVWSDEDGLPPLYGDVDSVVVTTFTLKDVFGEITKVKIDSKFTCTFNSEGDLSSLKLYNSDETVQGLARFDYDSNRKVLGSAIYGSNGTLQQKVLMRYDDKGRQSELSTYNSSGELEEKTLYKYDESGKLAEISNYNGSGALLNTETPKSGASDPSVRKHDAEGKLIERTLYGENGCCQWRIIYRYDAAGNVIEATKYETDIMIPRECVVYTIYYRK